MAWKITHDMLSVGEYADDSVVGRGVDLAVLKNVPVDQRITFKLLDDDMEHYFTGTADREAFLDDDTPSGLYGAYRWAMGEAGCTHLLMKVEDLCKLDPGSADTYRSHRMQIPVGPYKGWASIFS